MPANWKTVRVFISSTFRDMHAERDHLIKVTFPALREELEKYRVHLVDIDLRWGVTKEQADNDQALDVCLDQIDTCRPFFIGILGERYGYVSDTLPAHIDSKYGWIRHHTGKSITELEILHGVLNNPQMHSHSLFLFRDNRFLEFVPANQRKDLAAEDEASAAKLRKLKQAIRDVHMPVVTYACEFGGLKKNGDVQLTGLNEFGRQIAEWLGPAIKAELKLKDQPTLTETSPLVEESDFHERFIESRLRVYVGREQISNALLAFVEGDEPVPCLVTGPSGSGKSAALARFVTDYRQQHPQTLLVAHFIGASPASSNSRQMLRRFCLTLKSRIEFAEDIPQDFNELVNSFRDFLARIPADRRTVFVIDALNQLDPADNAQNLHWLPRDLPCHVKIIVSCIDDGDKSEPILQAFAHRAYHPVSVQALADDEQRQIIRAVPSLSAKTLDDVQVDLLLSNPATTNPLFLLVALEELRGFGSFEQLDRRIVEFPHPLKQEPRWHNWLISTRQAAASIPDEHKRQDRFNRLEQIESALNAVDPVDDTLTAVFLQVIDRLESDFEPQVSHKVLSLLASAREGLSERELQELLARLLPNHDGQRRDEEMQSVLRQVRSYLTRKGALLDFYHQSFLKAVHAKYLPTVESHLAAHRDLADYFADERLQPYWLRDKQTENEQISAGANYESPNNRKVVELPWQRLQAEQWQHLEELLCDWNFIGAKCCAGMVFDLQTDFKAALDALPEEKTARNREKEQQEVLRQYAKGLVDFAKGTSGALRILASTRPRTDAELLEECERTALNPTRTDRLRAFRDFVTSERHNLSSFSHLPGFCLQQAYNQANTGAVASSAERMLQSCNRGPMILRSPSWRPNFSPRPALLRTFGRQHGSVSVALTSDGKTAISAVDTELTNAGPDHALCVWDVATGQCRRTFDGHTEPVKSVNVTPDGSLAISGSQDGTLRVWDAATGQCVRTLKNNIGSVLSVSMSADAMTAVTGHLEGMVVWDLAADFSTILESEMDARCVAMTPDGRIVISGEMFGGCLRVWDLKTRRCREVLEGHEFTVESVALTPDGKRAVSGARDCTIRVWDLATSRCLHVLKGRDGEEFPCVQVTPDGNLAVSGSVLGLLQVWDLNTGQCIRTMEVPAMSGGIMSVGLTADGRTAVTGGLRGLLHVWDVANGQTSGSSPASILGQKVSVSMSEDDTVALVNSADCDCLWDVANGNCLKRLETRAGQYNGLSLAPDGMIVMNWGFGDEAAVRVFDLHPWQELCIVEGGLRAFTPDGKLVVSAPGSNGATTRIHDLRTGELLCFLNGDLLIYSHSPDGRTAIVVFEYSVWYWDLAAGRGLLKLEEHRGTIDAAFFTPDGRIAVLSLKNQLRVWDLVAGRCLHTILGHEQQASTIVPDYPLRPLLTRDGRTIWIGESDSRSRAWDLATGVCTSRFVHCTFDAISADGNMAICKKYGRLEIRDLNDGDCVAVLPCPDDSIFDSCLSEVRATNQFVYGSASGVVSVLMLHGFPFGPLITTAVHLWRYAANSSNGSWENNPTAICEYCHRRFAPLPVVLDAIYAINRSLDARRSPCCALPAEAWNDPQLLSECPHCGGSLKFNPFVMDNRDLLS